MACALQPSCHIGFALLKNSNLGVQVNHADVVHQDLLRFNRLWLSEFAADSLLVFSTGRSPELFKELAVSAGTAGSRLKRNLLQPMSVVHSHSAATCMQRQPRTLSPRCPPFSSCLALIFSPTLEWQPMPRSSCPCLRPALKQHPPSTAAPSQTPAGATLPLPSKAHVLVP